jgi:DNA-binding transcriptional ArsR family regulator
MVIEQVSKKFDERRTIEIMGMTSAGVAADVADSAPAEAAGDAAPEARPHPEREELELGAVLHALSDPMRLRIVSELASSDERTCSSFDLPIVKSTCTHHFKVLREAGVIRQRVVGTTRVNSLRREDLEARFPGLLDAVLKGAGAVQPA